MDINIILRREDIAGSARKKADKDITIYDFLINSEMINRATSVVYSNGKFLKIFKQR